MKHIFTSTASLIIKIAVWSSEKPRVISTHNVSLFGADFGQKASSDHTFLRTRLVKQRLLMVLDIATR